MLLIDPLLPLPELAIAGPSLEGSDADLDSTRATATAAAWLRKAAASVPTSLYFVRKFPMIDVSLVLSVTSKIFRVPYLSTGLHVTPVRSVCHQPARSCRQSGDRI